MSRRRTPLILIVCFGLACVMGLLGLFRESDRKYYDLILGLRSREPAPRELLRVDVDSDAVALDGALPWTGEKLSDGLSTLVEFEAGVVAIDLPPRKSSEGEIDLAALDALQPSIQKEYSGLEENILTLFEGLRTGSVPPAEAASSIAGLLKLVQESGTRLSEAAAALGGSGEEHFAAWSALQGRTYVAANPEPLAADSDGVLRRVSLMRKGSPDLSGPLNALKGRLDWKGFELKNGVLVLKSVLVQSAPLRKGEKRVDVFVPLDSDGRLLLPFRKPQTGAQTGTSGAKNDGAERRSMGPRRLSWAELSRAHLLEESLSGRLKELEDDLPEYARGEYLSLLDRQAFIQRLENQLLASPDTGMLAEWREARREYLERAGGFLRTNAPNSGAMRSYTALAGLRNRFAKEIPGAFCLVAAAYSSSDCRGPFGNSLSEADVEAALADSILSRTFLQEGPVWFSYVAAFAVAFILMLLWFFIGGRAAESGSWILALLCPALSALVFALKGPYLAPSLPCFCALSAALGLSFARALSRTTTPPPPTVER